MTEFLLYDAVVGGYDFKLVGYIYSEDCPNLTGAWVEAKDGKIVVSLLGKTLLEFTKDQVICGGHSKGGKTSHVTFEKQGSFTSITVLNEDLLACIKGEG